MALSENDQVTVFAIRFPNGKYHAKGYSLTQSPGVDLAHAWLSYNEENAKGMARLREGAEVYQVWIEAERLTDENESSKLL